MAVRAFVRTMMGAALLLAVPTAAEVSDIAVKAAFLPRFARYVTWPPSARAQSNGPIVLCVIGDDPFGAALNQAAASQQVDGRAFVVRRLASANGASECSIAFVDGSRTGETLAALDHR